MGFGFIAPVWPLYLGALGASAVDIGAVLGTGQLLTALCILPAGLLADRIGRRTVILAASVSGIAGALAFLPLEDWRGAFVGATLYELALVGLPVTTAYVALAEPRARVGRAMGLMYGAFFGGLILGSPLSGPLTAAIGPRAAILAGAALFAVSATCVLRTRDLRPAVAPPQPRLPRRARSLLAIMPVAALVSQLGVPLLPVLLRGPGGVPLELIGVYVSLFALGSASFSVIGGRLSDHVGPVATVVGLATVFASGAILLVVGGEPILLAVGAFMLGANVAADPVINAVLERVLPPASAASGYASFALAFVGGQGAASYAAGWLYEADPLLPWLVSGVIAVPMSAVVALVVRRLWTATPSGAA